VKVHRIDKVNHNASWLTSTAEKQVTLCVAVLKIGVNFTFDPVNADKNKTLITPPFNDVLFDAASFRGLGGEVRHDALHALHRWQARLSGAMELKEGLKFDLKCCVSMLPKVLLHCCRYLHCCRNLSQRTMRRKSRRND
jgi:hypothetical protein